MARGHLTMRHPVLQLALPHLRSEGGGTASSPGIYLTASLTTLLSSAASHGLLGLLVPHLPAVSGPAVLVPRILPDPTAAKSWSLLVGTGEADWSFK